MELSFWIAAHLGGPVAEEQQSLSGRHIHILGHSLRKKLLEMGLEWTK